MPISRKCPNCSTWNGEESHCINCGEVLDPELIRKEKDKESPHANRVPNSVDIAFHKMKNSKWLIVRVLFWIGFSVWFVLFSILSFFIALIAWTPG
ncbi:MAG: hypothetical protein HKN45_12170 [Flavobacteriales bacterium]|nr:hypothetical protein [Flavobacteriales bacterium]